MLKFSKSSDISTLILLITTIDVFNLFLLVDQVAVIGNESLSKQIFANICIQINHIGVIFMKFWVVVARHNLKWLKIVYFNYLFIK